MSAFSKLAFVKYVGAAISRIGFGCLFYLPLRHSRIMSSNTHHHWLSVILHLILLTASSALSIFSWHAELWWQHCQLWTRIFQLQHHRCLIDTLRLNILILYFILYVKHTKSKTKQSQKEKLIMSIFLIYLLITSLYATHSDMEGVRLCLITKCNL